jgi:hypothetical protein
LSAERSRIVHVVQNGAEDGDKPRITPMEVGLDEEGDNEYEAAHVRGVDDAWMRDIWSAPNRAVLASYFCVGFTMNFLATPLSYYLVHVLGE